MLWNGRRALTAPANRDPMLTRKGKYGLKALVHLAGLPPAQLAFVSDIAEANNVPKKFLDGILGDLRKAGLVRSKTGKGGGYMLARPAQDIRIGQVIYRRREPLRRRASLLNTPPSRPRNHRHRPAAGRTLVLGAARDIDRAGS
jgi:Rrf2 family protein